MGTDFNKINPEQAKEIINALKDGKINDKEAEKLKLTPQEQKDLNEAFSSGEVQIGDFVLVNKGKSKDGKKQYSQTKKAPQQTPKEEPGFFAKAWNRVKRDVAAYGQNFSNAWNKSDGFVETAGALVGATTKTATDIVKNNADYVEKGVAEATGSKIAGKVAKYVSGAGIAADAVEAVEDVGDWSAAKIRAAAEEYDGTEKALLLSFADFVDDMNAADIALLFVGGAGAAKGFKELPRVLQLLKGINVAKPVTVAATAAAAVGMTSCAGGDEQILGDITNINNAEVNVNISSVTQQTGLTKADLEALLKPFGVKLDVLVEAAENTQELIESILKCITQSNQLLQDIKNDMNENSANILKAIAELQASVNDITNLINKLPADIKAQFEGDLNAIINAIKNGNTSMAELKVIIEGLAEKLEGIIDRLDVNNKYQKDIKELLEKINSGQMSDSEKLIEMINLLKNIENITGEINNKLDVVINKLEGMYAQNENIQKYLAKIAEYIKQNNSKTDVTNELLQKLIDKSQGGGQGGGGLTEAQLEAILKAISENGNKIDVTNKLLADMKNGQEYILEAINKFGVDILNKMDTVIKLINDMQGDNTEVKAALENILKQLVKMDGNQQANAQKILDAIANIKVTGGGVVDLSSVEAMLAKLIELVGKNGEQLTDINAKLDVLNITAKAIEDKLDASNKDHKVIIDILNSIKDSQAKGYDDSKLLAILDLISGKLDDILAAIKDHDVKVTVDVTGKVSCECNCGGNHEGILGDLDDLLG